MKKNKISLDEALALLEKNTASLQSGGLSLDESIKLYQESKELYAYAASLLEETKQKIEIYRPESGVIENFYES